MTLKETLAQLEALGNERMRVQNLKNGSGDSQFGVRRGDVRKLAKKIKTNHELAMALWDTGNIDAQFLGILLLKPKALSIDEMDQMVRSITFVEVTDWFSSYVAKKHPGKEILRESWMAADHPMAARAGWSLTVERVAKSPEGLDLESLLDRIESEMGEATPEEQWTMNFCLIEIGVQFADDRERATAIGEAHGLYRDYPVSKGCVSPFAPIAIEEMAKRQG